MSQVAGMAQWQSNGVVNRGLGVRLPLPAPRTTARTMGEKRLWPALLVGYPRGFRGGAFAIGERYVPEMRFGWYCAEFVG